jgi:hypothetical protein
MKYTAITALIAPRGEYIALVPAFYNGHEYARTYSHVPQDLLPLVDDLIEQELLYREYNCNIAPSDVQYTIEDELKQYLPYDELEEGESFTEIEYTRIEARER